MSGYNLEKTIPVLERSIALFRPHHLELRKRLIRVCLSIVFFTVVAYIFSERIAKVFISPLFQASPLTYRLVYTNLPEAFLAYIKIALIVGTMCSMPVMLYQLWRFVAPGLKENEKKIALTIIFWSTLLFAGGACFAFFAVIPQMLTYFMSYASESLEPLPKIGKYLTFIARTVFAFGLAFQIPFLIVMTSKTGLITIDYFRKKRLYSTIGMIVLAFMLAAGDIMATLLLVIPLLLLYETGIFLGSLFTEKKGNIPDKA
ncbi:MAG: twin-arginine translocase subunit TatC [Deltaproteobacteria bacterium]|nr:MAG: twin-arginine translocase subunit TatC [Deltaproteobacteria bacterium]